MDLTNSRVRMIWGSLVTLSVIFGLQLIRVLLPLFGYFLRDTKGIGAMSLAPIALGIFALAFLAAPVRRLAGQSTALAITTGGLAILRVAEQISHDSMVDLFLAGAGVALFCMFIPIALEIARPSEAAGTSHFILALLVGLTVDTAIHTASWTVDLSWQSGLLATILVIVMAIVLLDLLWLALKRDGLVGKHEAPQDGWGWAYIVALSSLGPWLFLQLVVFQNVARMAASSGWSLPVSGMIIGLGNVVALVAASHAPRSKRVPGLIYLITAAFVFLLFFVNRAGLLGVVASVASQVLAASLITMVFIALGINASEKGRMGASAANGIAQLLFILMSFMYYVSYDMNLGFQPPAVLVAAAIFLGLTAILAMQRSVDGEDVLPDYRPVLIAVAFLALPLIVLQRWNSPAAISPPEGNRVVRVMDYNLHNGFNTAGQLNMEDLAQVIEDANADVIGLQEVSRGWLLNGSVDMMQWLSQRLQLPYVYGPTEGLLWGNAVLSRYPIVSDEAQPLPPDSLRLHRGYLVVGVNIGGEQVWIYNTHLHHLGEDSEIRQEQVPVLIEGWNGDAKSILMGDMNARPEDPEIVMLEEAGLVNVTAEVGLIPSHTYYAENPDHQIDYVWSSPDLLPLEAHIPLTTASDHLPIVADISVP